jgi:hypothetical protein
MSLTTEDLNEIRNVIESALARQTSKIIEPIQSEIQALRNDIKENIRLLSELQNEIVSDERFQKLSLEE